MQPVTFTPEALLVLGALGAGLSWLMSLLPPHFPSNEKKIAVVVASLVIAVLYWLVKDDNSLLAAFAGVLSVSQAVYALVIRKPQEPTPSP